MLITDRTKNLVRVSAARACRSEKKISFGKLRERSDDKASLCSSPILAGPPTDLDPSRLNKITRTAIREATTSLRSAKLNHERIRRRLLKRRVTSAVRNATDSCASGALANGRFANALVALPVRVHVRAHVAFSRDHRVCTYPRMRVCPRTRGRGGEGGTIVSSLPWIFIRLLSSRIQSPITQSNYNRERIVRRETRPAENSSRSPAGRPSVSRNVLSLSLSLRDFVAFRFRNLQEWNEEIKSR